MKNLNVFVLILIFQFIWIASDAQTRGDSLIVFVGELISIEELPNTTIRKEIIDGDTIEFELAPFDSKYKSKFRIIKLINGFYSQDIIEFISYNHYGIPKYSNYKTSLLFISEYENEELVQQKYMSCPVYKTKNGRWASDYNRSGYRKHFTDEITVKPEVIEFEVDVFYEKNNWQDFQKRFSSPYYKIEGNKAIAVYGNYVEELFEIRKQSILKSRGLF